jgi:glycosyltransferase involved in cell wall biosynthesis
MISVIIPTLGNRKKELIRLLDSLQQQTYQNFEVIVVSQDNEEEVKELLKPFEFQYKQVHILKKGLSHARNIGLKHVKGDIVTFSDDDCWYLPDSFQTVVSYFTENQHSIVCFQMFDPFKNIYLKNYPSKPQKEVSKRNLLTKSSIEIFINLNKIPKSILQFDEQFGLGARYPSGEENILLMDLHNLGYKIAYEPKIIVYHEKKEIITRLNSKTFIGKGPMFRRMFNLPTALLLITLFFVKKYPLLKEKNKLKILLSSLVETIRYKKVLKR